MCHFLFDFFYQVDLMCATNRSYQFVFSYCFPSFFVHAEYSVKNTKKPKKLPKQKLPITREDDSSFDEETTAWKL